MICVWGWRVGVDVMFLELLVIVCLCYAYHYSDGSDIIVMNDELLQ